MGADTDLLDPAILEHQVARLQRKAQRQKEALARLETQLARMKRQLRKKSEDCLLAEAGLKRAGLALTAEAPTQAAICIEGALLAIRLGTPEAREHALAAAKKRDQTLLTLRAKVTELHAALMRAKRTIHGLTQMEEYAWALYQDSPEMQQINRALGE